jgi:hypothetical protein
MSISLSTTSTGTLVFCKIHHGLICIGRFNYAIAAVSKELHHWHADQDIVIEDEYGSIRVGRVAVAVGTVHARCCALDK